MASPAEGRSSPATLRERYAAQRRGGEGAGDDDDGAGGVSPRTERAQLARAAMSLATGGVARGSRDPEVTSRLQAAVEQLRELDGVEGRPRRGAPSSKLEFRVPLLAHGNYRPWKDTVLLWAEYHKLTYTLVSDVSGAVDPDDDLVMSTFLRLHMSEAVRAECTDCLTARDIWRTLLTKYEGATFARYYSLLEQLYNLSQRTGESLEDYWSRGVLLADHLAVLERKPRTVELIAVLLRGLLPQYGVVKSILRFSITDKSSLGEVLAQLQLHVGDQRRGSSAGKALGVDTSDDAMMASGKPRRKEQRKGGGKAGGFKSKEPNKPRSSGGKDFKCYNCGESGHIAAKCPKPKQSKSTSESGGKAKSVDFAFAATAEATSPCEAPCAEGVGEWFLDSGATYHFCRDLEAFASLDPERKGYMNVASKHRLRVAGMGTVLVRTGAGRHLRLKDVRYVPDLGYNLLSERLLDLHGAVIVTRKGTKTVYAHGYDGPLLTAVQNHMNQYVLDWCVLDTRGHGRALMAESPALWHRRLGHVSYGILANMTAKEAVKGVNTPLEAFKHEAMLHKHMPCPACVMGRGVRQPFTDSDSEFKSKPLGIVAADLQGPITPASLSGARYALLTRDLCTGTLLFAPLKAKSDAPQVVKHHILQLEASSGLRCQHFLTDEGTEFLKLKDWLDARGIVHLTTCRYTPEQNGAVERANRTIAERFRSMMAETGVPPECWAEGYNYAAWLMNRTARQDADKTPLELLMGVKPDLSMARVFGSLAFHYMPKELRKKLDMRAMPGVFMGIDNTRKGYRIMLPDKRVIVARDAVVNEYVAGWPTLMRHYGREGGALEYTAPRLYVPFSRIADMEHRIEHGSKGAQTLLLEGPASPAARERGIIETGNLDFADPQAASPVQEDFDGTRAGVVVPTRPAKPPGNVPSHDESGQQTPRLSPTIHEDDEDGDDAPTTKTPTGIKRIAFVEASEVGGSLAGGTAARTRAEAKAPAAPDAPVRVRRSERIAEQANMASLAGVSWSDAFAKYPTLVGVCGDCQCVHMNSAEKCTSFDGGHRISVVSSQGSLESTGKGRAADSAVSGGVAAATEGAESPYDPASPKDWASPKGADCESSPVWERRPPTPYYQDTLRAPSGGYSVDSSPRATSRSCDSWRSRSRSPVRRNVYSRMADSSCMPDIIASLADEQRKQDLLEQLRSTATSAELGIAAATADPEALGLPPFPRSMEEAFKHPVYAKAAHSEVQSLVHNGTFVEVPESDMPAGQRALDCKCVWAVKTDASGAFERAKLRIVVRGFMQRAGIDYHEVFAPTLKHVTARVFLTVVAAKGLPLRFVDIKTAFLNGYVHEEIWVRPPPGITKPGTLWKLVKALYGLKQAPREWYNQLAQDVKGKGFAVAVVDPALFVRKGKGKHDVSMVYVDDMAITGLSDAHADKTVRDMQELYDLREADITKQGLLGMGVARDMGARTIGLSQCRLVDDILAITGLTDARPVSTPLPVNTNLVRDGTPLDVDDHPYATVVGKLMYLAVMTRPDLAHAVNTLARYMAVPTEEHWAALKHVCRYIKGTRDVALVLGGSDSLKLVGYCDANYGGDLDTRRSTTAYVFKLGDGVVSWQSRLQPTVAVSTAEAEYMAAAAAVKEALWLAELLDEFDVHVKPVTIFCDNQAAIKLLTNPVTSPKSKHIDIQHHFARERVAMGEVVFEYCPTASMVADALTKSVPAPTLVRHREAMQLV